MKGLINEFEFSRQKYISILIFYFLDAKEFSRKKFKKFEFLDQEIKFFHSVHQ